MWLRINLSPPYAQSHLCETTRLAAWGGSQWEPQLPRKMKRRGGLVKKQPKNAICTLSENNSVKRTCAIVPQLFFLSNSAAPCGKWNNPETVSFAKRYHSVLPDHWVSRGSRWKLACTFVEAACPVQLQFSGGSHGAAWLEQPGVTGCVKWDFDSSR